MNFKLLSLQRSIQLAQLVYSITPVESAFLKGSPAVFPTERVPIIQAQNILELGKLTALSFIKWVKKNSSGVVSLPTGKTPEYFIKYIQYFKENWQTPSVQRELQEKGIKSDTFPDTSKLKFVQMDEFFGINPSQKNSFRRHYITS